MLFDTPEGGPIPHDDYPAEEQSCMHGYDQGAADYGAAVLDGRSMEEKIDTDDTTVTPYTETSDTPSSPAVQEVEALFATSGLEAAMRRGDMRLSKQVIRPRHLEYSDNPHPAECAEVYAELLERHDRAAAGLLEAMGYPEPKEAHSGSGVMVYESWHYEERALPDGQPVRLAHSIQVHNTVYSFDKETPPDMLRAPAVTTRSYVVHQPHHEYGMMYAGHHRKFTGPMEYDIIFESDATERSIERPELQPVSNTGIAGQVAQDIQKAAKEETLEAWVDRFLALPQPTQEVSMAGYDGYTAPGLFTLMCKAPNDRKMALDMLHTAFTDENYAGLPTLFNIPFSQLDKLTRDYGAIAERYAWIIHNADTIYGTMLRTEKIKAGVEFLPRYKALLRKEEIKIARLEALTAKLHTMANINHCKPAQVSG